MVFLMATIFGDVQYSQVMGHLPTPDQPGHISNVHPNHNHASLLLSRILLAGLGSMKNRSFNHWKITLIFKGNYIMEEVSNENGGIPSDHPIFSIGFFIRTSRHPAIYERGSPTEAMRHGFLPNPDTPSSTDDQLHRAQKPPKCCDFSVGTLWLCQNGY